MVGWEGNMTRELRVNVLFLRKPVWLVVRLTHPKQKEV